MLAAAFRPLLGRLLAYLASLGLAIAGSRLGDASNSWWYLLNIPLFGLVIAEIPGTLRNRREARSEHARVRDVARERGTARHIRPGRTRLNAFEVACGCAYGLAVTSTLILFGAGTPVAVVVGLTSAVVGLLVGLG